MKIEIPPNTRAEFAQLHKKASNIASLYYHAKTKIALRAGNVFDFEKPSENTYEIKEANVEYQNGTRPERIIFAVDTAISHMESECQKLIVSEYFTARNNFWWINYYSRSTFYRWKRRALVDFLSFFE